MNIVFLSQSKGHVGSVNVCLNRLILIAIIAFLVPVAMIYFGYYWGYQAQQSNDPANTALRTELATQRDELNHAVGEADRHMAALSKQLGKMQARVIRLDALGRRLTKIAKLDKGEFDFDKPPARGGPASSEALQAVVVPDFLNQLKELSSQLDSRVEQLSVLETMMMSSKLQKEVFPKGRPIAKGWTSSYYGMRTDPFSGKREHHKGVDFAGKDGTPVSAVAAGVVTWAAERYGYGYMVEVNHGNGYITRYGHNKALRVKVGDKVNKGDELALMGSTGRSTGPHVHFEVLKNGRNVDPLKYVNAR